MTNKSGAGSAEMRVLSERFQLFLHRASAPTIRQAVVRNQVTATALFAFRDLTNFAGQKFTTSLTRLLPKFPKAHSEVLLAAYNFMFHEG